MSDEGKKWDSRIKILEKSGEDQQCGSTEGSQEEAKI